MLKLLYCIFAVAGAAILISMIKTKKFFTALFLSALQGIIAVFAVNAVGGFFGVHINVNTVSLALSALGGIPGVIFLLITDIFFV